MKRFRVGPFRVEPTLNQIVLADGSEETTRIEPKAMEVLTYLAARAGEVVDKDSVIRDVWGGAFVTNEVLTNAIWELRRALGDDAKSSTFIQTIPKRGYRMVAPVSFEEQPQEETPPPRSVAPRFFLGALLVLLLGLAVSALRPRADPSAAPMVRFSVELAEPLAPFFVPAVAIAPDSSAVAYATSGKGIYLRRMEGIDSTLVPGTEGGIGPFFSADGEALGFYSEGSLKTIRLDFESMPRVAARIGAPRGAAWGSDGWVYLTRGSSDGLHRARPDGSEIEELTTLAVESGEWTHRWPDVLPGARAVLFTVARSDLNGFDDADLEVLDLETRERKPLIRGAGFGRYVRGAIVFVRGRDLQSVPIDERSLALVGEPRTILREVKTYPINGAGQFSFSRDGSLAYVPGAGSETLRRLVSIGRDGSRRSITEDARLFYDPALSPDGTKIAVSVVTDGNSDIWIYDTRRSTLTRLTTSAGEEEHPLFRPDGRSLVYDYAMAGSFRLHSRPVDGSGKERGLGRGARNERAEAFSPDGETLVFSSQDRERGFDLGLLPIEETGEERPLLQTPFDERYARVSPDGGFVAYSSNESGRFEVYVTTFPDPGPRLQVSVEGGSHPSWTRGGKEIVYLTHDAVLAVPIATSPALAAGAPQKLFEWRSPLPSLEGAYRKVYDVSADGERFVMVESEDDPSARRLYVALGFWEER